MRLSEPGIHRLTYIKSMLKCLSLMSRVVWLSAGTWQHAQFVACWCDVSPRLPYASPQHGAVLLPWVLGDLELRDHGTKVSLLDKEPAHCTGLHSSSDSKRGIHTAADVPRAGLPEGPCSEPLLSLTGA